MVFHGTAIWENGETEGMSREMSTVGLIWGRGHLELTEAF